MNPSKTISILLPTWRRPVELRRCLRAIGAQTLQPTQVVVTVRRDDAQTLAALDQLRKEGETPPGLELVLTDVLPLTAAMNSGLARTTGDLVAMTDDDAEPRVDWLQRISASFSDPAVGGVGGRDWQLLERWHVQRVGSVCWFGRVIGNHHLGAGPPRDVDLLKGVNCCFRGDALRKIGFDRRLRGRGNVNHWEMSLCFAFRRAGWRLVYDPAIGVDHHVAQRHDGDVNARGGFDRPSHVDAVHNETLAVLEYLSPLGWPVCITYFLLMGTREAPGVAQVPRLFFQGDANAVGRWWAALEGRCHGIFSRMKHNASGLPVAMRRGHIS